MRVPPGQWSEHLSRPGRLRLTGLRRHPARRPADTLATTMAEWLELPRPLQLARTAGWNLAESAGLPVAAYALGTWLGGRDAGLVAGLAAIWIAAAIRKLASGNIPSLIAVSAIVLTVQTALAVASGNLWIFLLHFPVANLFLCVFFARSARGPEPLCARLAGEVIGLRQPAVSQPGLLRFFQHVTLLWAGIFLLLGVAMAGLLATQPVAGFLLLSAVATVALIAAGIAISAVWFRFVLRKHGLRLRFCPVRTHA